MFSITKGFLFVIIFKIFLANTSQQNDSDDFGNLGFENSGFGTSESWFFLITYNKILI